MRKRRRTWSMAKFATDEKDKKFFDPISTKTLASLASPAPQPPPPAPVETPIETLETSEEEEPKVSAPREKPAKKRSALLKVMRKPPKNERLDRVVKCLLTPS